MNLKLSDTGKNISINFAMKSAEFGTFPCLISLPNAREVFGDKKSVTEKVLSPYERLCIANRARDPFQNERTTVSPQSLK